MKAKISSIKSVPMSAIYEYIWDKDIVLEDREVSRIEALSLLLDTEKSIIRAWDSIAIKYRHTVEDWLIKGTSEPKEDKLLYKKALFIKKLFNVQVVNKGE